MSLKKALVCIAKDEDEYLEEWIDYHIKVGFDQIFIYQNNWRFKQNKKFPESVHFIEFDGHRMQNKCYNDFILSKCTEFDWALFTDVDEFLYVEGDLESWLESMQNEEVIYIHWRLFGDSGLSGVKDGNYSVIQRFTQCQRNLNRLGKNFINFRKTKNMVIFNNPHIVFNRLFGCLPSYSDPSGRKYTGSSPFQMVLPWEDSSREKEKAEIYHFRNKTWEENVKRKLNTDDAFHESSKCDFRTDINAVKREFDKHNSNEVENLKLIAFMERK